MNTWWLCSIDKRSD